MNITYDFFEDKVLQNFYFAMLNGVIIWVSFGKNYDEVALEKDLVDYLKEPITLTHEAHPEISDLFMAYLSQKIKDLPLAFKVMHSTDFQNQVYAACFSVDYGETKSYGELAKSIGNPNAARAVGQAMRRNPIPLIIPCHRIIGSDFKMIGYGGKEGVATKAYLLELEGVMIQPAPSQDSLF